MARADWCLVNPGTGTGDGNVSVSALTHTGRVERNTTLTFEVTGLSDSIVSVSQEPKEEFAVIYDASASKDGGIVTLNGTTNSSKLTFSVGEGELDVTLPGTYKAGGADTPNGAEIEGDPGADAQFDFTVDIAYPENETIEIKERVITITTAGGQTKDSLITQEKGDPKLVLQPTSIELDSAGTMQTITVTSNAPWTIS